MPNEFYINKFIACSLFRENLQSLYDEKDQRILLHYMKLLNNLCCHEAGRHLIINSSLIFYAITTLGRASEDAKEECLHAVHTILINSDHKKVRKMAEN